MIPVLFEVDERLFNTNGLGKLSDAIQCTVTEERNGQFELYLQYPVDGEHYEELAHSRLIFAVPADGVGAKPFRIYRISKPMNGRVEVFAEHISYQLSQCIVKPFEATGINQVFAALKANSVIEYPFNYDSNGISTSKEFSLTAPASVRSIMGGQDGSIIDTFGGEWEWGTAASQFVCTLHQSRGRDRGVSIRYGKNLLDLTQEENIQNTVTGIVPFWKGQNEAQEEDYVFLKDGYILKDGISESYPYQRLELVDLTQQFDGKPDSEELLLEAQAYIASHDIGKPTVNLTISFVALWQTEEYKDIAPLERVNLCDTVTVEFEKLGVSVSAKVVKTVYNVLLDRYDSIELGETKGTLAKTVQQSIDTVKKDIEDAKSTYATKAMVNQALDEASAKITGGLGGYVVINTNADGEPQEILVMNTPDKTTATSVMRINKNGIGFATGPNAYDGPFNSAWTIDGRFNASFIATGSLLADLIKTGMIKSADGTVYFDLDNNELVCSQLVSKKYVIEATQYYPLTLELDREDKAFRLFASSHGDDMEMLKIKNGLYRTFICGTKNWNNEGELVLVADDVDVDTANKEDSYLDKVYIRMIRNGAIQGIRVSPGNNDYIHISEGEIDASGYNLIVSKINGKTMSEWTS